MKVSLDRAKLNYIHDVSHSVNRYLQAKLRGQFFIKNKLITFNSRIMDYGSGNGMLGIYLVENRVIEKIDCYDPSIEVVEQAKILANTINISANINDFKNKKYDFIYSGFVYPKYVSDRKEFFKNIDELLNKSGILVLEIDNPKSWYLKLCKYNLSDWIVSKDDYHNFFRIKKIMISPVDSFPYWIYNKKWYQIVLRKLISKLFRLLKNPQHKILIFEKANEW